MSISASTLQYLTLHDGTKLILMLGDSHASKSRGRSDTWTCSESYGTRSSSSTRKPPVVRRVVLGTNLTYFSQTLHARGQRHGMVTTNGSGREKSNPLTAGGLLKILRDLHTRPYPMVQGIGDHVLANSLCGG